MKFVKKDNMVIKFPSFQEFVAINENKLVDNLHDTIKNALVNAMIDVKLYKTYNISVDRVNKILEDATNDIMDEIAKGI